ncbi:CpaE family protein [Microvirga sp. GCM10011540]|uniref:AAA family ATPase n=1 Tax=Microvirga sp. GCM10011540 TaxID=3317338 RepID=UPI00361B36FD
MRDLTPARSSGQDDFERHPDSPGLEQLAAPVVSTSSAKAEITFSDRRLRDTVRMPRITIHAFFDTPEIGVSIHSAAADRLMSRVKTTVRGGGLAAAVEFYRQSPTPNLILVESRSADSTFLSELDSLAEVCDAGTKVMAIGHTNDISFYRELMRRGVSEYLVAPTDPFSLIRSISDLYGETTSTKLGQIYAFVGAKGGVGSSVIAHNVAWSIASRLSLDVIVADMDLPFGTASLDFNVDPSSGIAEAIQDVGRLDEVLLDRLLTKCSDHLNLLSAPANLEGSYDLAEAAMEPLLDLAQATVPYLILDMPHLWTAWARKTLLSADEIVITATPDLANLRNTKSLVGFLRQARPNDPLPRLVLNQVGVPKRPEIKPLDFAKAVQLDISACVPFDANLFGTAANNGQVIADVSARAAAPKIIAGLADALTGRSGQKRRRLGMPDMNSLLGRISRLPFPSTKGVP